jgi:DNA-binding NarL/FixJ family response regulator
MPISRILIVDDYEPLRRFVRSTLQHRDDVHIIGEAKDGLEAVQKAEELRPDLIILDIGLPTLNGIQVAKRLRDLVPHAQILFFSEESSLDVVREALNLGAAGYVRKLNAYSELLPAVETVLRGEQFVGSSPEGGSESTTAQAPPHCHEMLIYSDDSILLQSFTRFVEAALKARNPAIVIATKSHLDSLVQRLSEKGLDVAATTQNKMFFALDVTEVLSRFMVNDLPDPIQFVNVATDLIDAAAEGAKGVHARTAACGVCAPILWSQGKTDAAVLLEQLWDDLAKTHELDILCAYPSTGFHGRKDERAFKNICAQHSEVYSR